MPHTLKVNWNGLTVRAVYAALTAKVVPKPARRPACDLTHWCTLGDQNESTIELGWTPVEIDAVLTALAARASVLGQLARDRSVDLVTEQAQADLVTEQALVAAAAQDIRDCLVAAAAAKRAAVTAAGNPAAEAQVLALVQAELRRTAENNDTPTVGDYLADVVRHLARQLPAGDPLREAADDGVSDDQPGSPPRPSHDHLMDAARALGKAHDVEQQAGNHEVARVLNDSAINLLALSIDTRIPDNSQPGRG